MSEYPHADLRLEEIELERQSVVNQINYLRRKLGELANEAWGIHTELARNDNQDRNQSSPD